MRFLPLAFVLFALPAQAWTEPPRGSAERRAMMDAMRPLAEWDLGAPIEFIVQSLRVEGKVAFAAVQPQRPGGIPIDLARTPLVERDGMDPDYLDGPAMQALLQKQGNTWVVVHHGIGATDVWYADPVYCENWGPVLPEICR